MKLEKEIVVIKFQGNIVDFKKRFCNILGEVLFKVTLSNGSSFILIGGIDKSDNDPTFFYGIQEEHTGQCEVMIYQNSPVFSSINFIEDLEKMVRQKGIGREEKVEVIHYLGKEYACLLDTYYTAPRKQWLVEKHGFRVNVTSVEGAYSIIHNYEEIEYFVDNFR